MKKFGEFLFVLFFSLIFIFSNIVGRSSSETEKVSHKTYAVKNFVLPTKKKINGSLQALSQQDLALPISGGNLHILDINMYRNFHQISQMLNQPKEGQGIYTYRVANLGVFTMSAEGIDGLQHIANTYLEGYEPFKVSNVMMPLYVLSQRKSYMLDEKQYKGRLDVWQSSRQAFYYPRGDCEDHAIALADWLIEMGEDARVVIGDYDGDGHAWVVLFKNSKEYLLEATKKSAVSRTKPYPIAVLHKKYHPEYMFNRAFFWDNTASKYTSKYSGKAWKKKSQYNKS